MPAVRPLPSLVLHPNDAARLQSLAGSETLPHSIVQRAKIVLTCAAGETNTAITKLLEVRGSRGAKASALSRMGNDEIYNELKVPTVGTCTDDSVSEVINQTLQNVAQPSPKQ